MTIRRSAAALATLVAALTCVPVALGAPPTNDDFADALVLGVDGTIAVTNAEATKELFEPNHAGDPGGASVWFSWTAPRSGTLRVDTCDSSFDTLLAAYTGATLIQLSVAAANDDSCGEQSAIELAVNSGTTYRIAVDGAGGATGSILLRHGMAPLNDDFEGAQVLSGPSEDASGSNAFASHESGEPFHAGAMGSGSVWYRWTAPHEGRFEFNACETVFDAVLAVYRGGQMSGLSEVASDDDGCAPGAQGPAVVFDAEANSTYAIAVDGYSEDDWGAFVLRWNQLFEPPEAVIAPSIAGTPLDGEILTGDLGRWDGSPPITFEHWWELCEPTRCVIVATGRTIRASAGQRLRFGVRARNHAYATAYSPLVTVGYRPPVNVAPPRIAGRPYVGLPLTLETFGEWTGTSPLSFAFHWQRCRSSVDSCVDIEGEGAKTAVYEPVAADIGAVLRVIVTVSNNGGQASAPSPPTVVVARLRPAARPVCRVPRLVGKTLRAARRSLARSRCRLGSIRRARSSRKVGVVVAQRPRAGTRLRSGGRVNVVLSLGRRR